MALPPLDHQHLGRVLVEDEGAAGGDRHLVLPKRLVDLRGPRRERREQRAALEELLREREQRERRERVRPDLAVLVLVEPEGELDLEEQPLEGLVLLRRHIHHEAHRQVVDHLRFACAWWAWCERGRVSGSVRGISDAGERTARAAHLLQRGGGAVRARILRHVGGRGQCRRPAVCMQSPNFLHASPHFSCAPRGHVDAPRRETPRARRRVRSA